MRPPTSTRQSTTLRARSSWTRSSKPGSSSCSATRSSARPWSGKVCRSQRRWSMPTRSRRPFRDYVEWLRRQDQAEPTRYWSALLADFDSPNQLPFDARPGSVPPSGQPPKELRLELSESATDALVSLSKQLRCTMSTLLQGAWAILLGRYSGRDEVVFGATTSGRTPQ